MSVLAAIRDHHLDAVESRLTQLAREYASDPLGWPFAPRFSTTSRWYGRIGADSGHEAWLLTWLPGQHTELHNHGGSSGAFAVVSGRLTEQVAVTVDEPVDEPVARVELRRAAIAAGTVRTFGARHVHRIVNHGPTPAVSVHVYAPALRELTNYQLDDGRLSVSATTRAGVDW